jgi:hypothetical protein
MMDQAATDRFNEILAQWRREGRQIGWPELQEAFRLAQKEGNSE